MATAANSGTFGDVGDDTVAITASSGTITQDNAARTWSWSRVAIDVLALPETITITATDSDGAVTTTTFDIVVGNTPPSVTKDQDSVTATEGMTATNSGTFGDVDGDTVTITTSIGTITQDNVAKTWNWRFDTTTSSVSQTVSLTATDSDGDETRTSFELIVNTAYPLVRLALQLDADLALSLTTSPRQNALGLNEKWLRDIGKGLFYLTPDGKLYAWRTGFLPVPTLVGTLTREHYNSPALLVEAAMRLDTSPIGLPATLSLLDEVYGFEFNGEHWPDWGNRDEKWLKDRNDRWYFILPNGELYVWDGKPLATGDLVANLGPTIHANPSLLWDAYVAGEGEGSDAVQTGTQSVSASSLSSRELEPPFPIRIGTWTNPLNVLDVNQDGNVSPLDVLIIINRLNDGARAGAANEFITDDSANSGVMYYDVSNDGFASPLDALMIINALNVPRPPEPDADDDVLAFVLANPERLLSNNPTDTALEQYLAENDELQ